MFNFIKNSFRRTNDCIILITPLVIFISLFNLYFNYIRDFVNTLPKMILACFSCLILLSGMFSAWFYMVKKTLLLSDKIFLFEKDRGKELINILLSFSKGIGKYFLSFFIGIFLILSIYGIVYCLVDILVEKFVGRVDISFVNTDNMLISINVFEKTFQNFAKKEPFIFNFWYLSQFLGFSIVSFLLMLFIPEIIYKTQNPFKALVKSIRNIFSKFSKALLLYLYLGILYLIISLINLFLLPHPLFFVIILIQCYYFIMYFVTSIFTFYEWEYVINE